jgi:hypothetical protein
MAEFQKTLLMNGIIASSRHGGWRRNIPPSPSQPSVVAHHSSMENVLMREKVALPTEREKKEEDRVCGKFCSFTGTLLFRW